MNQSTLFFPDETRQVGDRHKWQLSTRLLINAYASNLSPTQQMLLLQQAKAMSRRRDRRSEAG